MLAACAPSGDTDVDVTINGGETSSVGRSAPYLEDDSSESSEDSVEIDVNAGASAAAGTTRVVRVTVTDWEFAPTLISAKKGEKVQLELVGGTGIHSFAVPGLEMNVRVEPGQVVKVDLPTDTVGSFDASCRIPCGPGHKDMKAKIVIS